MRSENGIPRPFQPNNQAQELRDLKRKVAELESRRTFVSVERIVEGGTINENVGKQLAETVQKDIQLTADQVAIGEAGNLERDPNFEQLGGWDPVFLSDPTVTRHAGGGYNGANAISFPTTDAVDQVSGVWRYTEDGRFSFPVEAGGKYRVSCWVQPDKDIPAQGVALFLRASTPEEGYWGVEVEESAQNAVPIRAGEWARITGIVTMPENATSAFLGYFRFAGSNGVVVRYSTPTVRASLTNDLLDTEFFRGLRIVGASIETNEEPKVGVKLNDGGATAHGHADETVSTGAKIAHRVRAALANRRSQWGVSDTDLWPGVWFESEAAQDDSRVRPKWPAHVTVGDALALGVVTRSAMQDDTAGYSQSGVEPGVAYMSSYKDAASAGGIRAGSYFGLFRDRFRLSTSNASGQTLVGLESNDSDNSLRITAPGGVLVNGAPIGSGGGGTAVQHAEFTTSMNLASSANQIKLNTAFIRDSNLSTNDSFATGSTGRIRLDAGVYAISFQAGCGAPMGPTPELAIKNDDTGAEYIALGLVANRWNGVTSDPAVYLPTAQNLAFWVKQDSGSAKTCTARVRIEKIK